MILQRVFSPKSIILDLQSQDKDELFEEMLQAALESQPDINRDEAMEALLAREAKMTTGILPQVAVPHCSIDTVRGIVGSLGISGRGVDYDSLDGQPVHYVFMMLCNASEDALHLEALKNLAAVLKNPFFVKALSEAKSAEEVHSLLGKTDFFYID